MNTNNYIGLVRKYRKKWFLSVIIGVFLSVLLGIVFPTTPLQSVFFPNKKISLVKGVKTILPERSEKQAPVPPSSSGPYGFTVLSFQPQTVTSLKQLGVTWVRYQLNWYKIEAEPNQFNWSELDSAVALANANNIHITFPLQDAPDWALSQTCQGVPFLPNAATFADFAQTVAQRYNGHNGHGYIDSYEVGNEEFDNVWVGTWEKSIPCRQPNFYGPILKAAYKAIKAQSPKALVGMFGLLWSNTEHIRTYMEGLYNQGYGAYFDFANFHYYRCGINEGSSDPSVTSPGSYPKGDYPSFNLEWQIMHDVMVRNHNGSKPIWVTETGWTTSGLYQSAQCIVTPDQQAQYLSYVTNNAMNSHVVQHVFWYTIGVDDGMSLTQSNNVPLPSFYALQTIVKLHPLWS